MKLSETSIRRPVLASVMSLLLVLVGLVSFNQLSLREYPRIDEPVVNVQHAADRRVVRGDRVAGHQAARGLDRRHRRRRHHHVGVARRAQPDHGALQAQQGAPTTAAADVRDRVARVRGRLPDAVDEPVIAKVEADATPTIWLAFTSETLSTLELTDLINRIVKPRLQTVPGVADVQIGGDRRYCDAHLARPRPAGRATG